MNVEDQLRARLHQVEDLHPPQPDFELRALRAGRDRMRRRQNRIRAAVGVAAAVVVVGVAVPAVGVFSRGASSTSSSAESGVAANAPAQQAPVPEQDKQANGVTGDSSTVPDLQRLTTELGIRYRPTFTALTLETTATGQQLVLHVTSPTPGALAQVRAQFPSLPVTVSIAPFSAASCQVTQGRVESDRGNLTSQGYALAGLRCDSDGRVVVGVVNVVTAEQIAVLETRYGDAVRVEQQVPPTTS